MSKCPSCNSDGCYIPLISKPECLNKDCQYFSQRQYEETLSSKKVSMSDSTNASSYILPISGARVTVGQMSFDYTDKEDDVSNSYFVPGSIYFSDRED